MAGGNRLFRESAMNKMASPEQLDVLMKVVTPKGWLVLITVLCILTVVVIWGFTGSISTKVNGIGVLVTGGGVFEVTAQTSGRITDLPVHEGDIVEEGQVIARIGNPKLLQEMARTESELSHLTAQYLYLKSIRAKESTLLVQEKQQKTENLIVRRANLLKQEKVARAKLKNMKKLFQDGIVSKSSVYETQNQLNTIEQTIASTKLEKGRISIDEAEEQLGREKEINTMEEEIKNTEQQLFFLREQLLREGRILAPYAGRVLEVMVSNRGVISAGNPVISIERSGRMYKELELVAYLPSGDGKQVKMGMDMMIVLSTVKKEEYGSLLGKVISVSEYPETTAGMMRTLGNESMVKSMSKLGTSIKIVADLIPKPDNISKYRWTSKHGAPVTLQSGTICQVEVVVHKQKPATLVIPTLKKILGLG